MRKSIKCSLLAITLCGITWLGNVSPADAYMYGIYNNRPQNYPMQMADGINLCYTQMDSGIYVDETSAYIASQNGPKFTLEANLIYWNNKNGSQSIHTTSFLYDTKARKIYPIYDGKINSRSIGPAQYHTSEAELRHISQALQIWHAVMKKDWRW